MAVDTAYAGSEDETKLIEAIAAFSTAATIFCTNAAFSSVVAVVVSIAIIIDDILVVAAAITSDVIFSTLNIFNNKSAASVNWFFVAPLAGIGILVATPAALAAVGVTSAIDVAFTVQFTPPIKH